MAAAAPYAGLLFSGSSVSVIMAVPVAYVVPYAVGIVLEVGVVEVEVDVEDDGSNPLAVVTKSA